MYDVPGENRLQSELVVKRETPYCLLEGRHRLTAIENLNDLSMCLDFKLQLHCVLRMVHSTVLLINDRLIAAQKMYPKMKHLHPM